MKKYNGKKVSDLPEQKIESPKIELVNCPRGGLNCKSQLHTINNLFTDADNYRLNREYQQAIFALKQGFEKTFELDKNTCLKCAEMFRLEIIGSIKNLKIDLDRMSRGFFRKKNRTKESIALADKTIKELQERIKVKVASTNNLVHKVDDIGQLN